MKPEWRKQSRETFRSNDYKLKVTLCRFIATKTTRGPGGIEPAEPPWSGVQTERWGWGSHDDVDFECSRYQFSFQAELLPSSTAQWLKHRPLIRRVAGSIPPGPCIVYCSFGCSKPAECYFQFVIITSEYSTVQYSTVQYSTVQYQVNTCWQKQPDTKGRSVRCCTAALDSALHWT